MSLKDFPGGVGVEQKRKYSSAQLGPELGNKLGLSCAFSFLYIDVNKLWKVRKKFLTRHGQFMKNELTIHNQTVNKT